MLEGPDLLVAALDAGVELDAVFVDVDDAERFSELVARAKDQGVAVHPLARGVLATAADAANPQGIAATCAPSLVPLAAALGDGVTLVACDLADPGNLGTVLRSADAAGCAGVVVCGDGVDVSNPKALRASAGSVFAVPVATAASLEPVVDALHDRGRRVLGAVARGGAPMWSARLPGAALVIGGEARGLDPAALALLDGLVSIPMPGAAESLNAGVAASILAFEALRQRTATGGPPEASPTI